MAPLLEVTDAQKYFKVHSGGVIRRKYKWCKAVDGVSFTVEKGDCFGIAGESGSGKTTLVNLILLTEKLTSGSITFSGKDVAGLHRHDLMWYRRSVQTVFQDAGRSLSPRMRIGDIVGEPLLVHARGRADRKVIKEKVQRILCAVGLGTAAMHRYAHELSGGQKQRVAIARAVVLEPSLVILDEPVSSLDVSIRAQILNLLADIQEEHDLSYIIVAHDLAMLRQVTHRIAVMYLGQIVEMGDTELVFANPLHPYTRSLLAAMPLPEPGRKRKAAVLRGEIANAIDPPPGCRFHPRCPQSCSECSQNQPVLREIEPGHLVACDREGCRVTESPEGVVCGLHV
jgi:oligopeptide/dipeptide ABC transporter ATP-binding protein